ncbi:MAG: insulinase family protein [Odoribacter sp.]|nr:insulinase family protein [Odoribacter sp.]
MNKLFKSGIALLTGIMAAFSADAQAVPGQIPALPVDPEVIVGSLPNGLTYYIRHNETPKGQADFYIAQKVGSILEEENQRGLAHFLEHMCFNGTDNFPGKGIINWLESIGVKFGYNLNAYTSVDETVYNISAVPVARTTVQDSCLLILHDWSCGLTLDPAEIDAERGVIHEEWRRSMVGQMRILEQLLPTIYPDNKYGQRLPIGIMDVVDNFPPQAIVDYYHTWYRPDQQAIIVVGDIDPAYIESKIKEIFEPIKMPENAKERYYVPVEDTPGTIVAIGKDAEMTAPVGLLFFKFDQQLPREMRNTQAYYAIEYFFNMIQTMLNSRLDELASTPDAPFAHASVDIDNFFLASTKDALTVQVIGKGDNLLQGMEAAYREILRALRGGFTQGEYERATAELRSRYQRLYDSRNNTPNESYSKEYVRAFIDNEPIPGIDIEKQIYDMLSQAIPVDQIGTILPEIVTADNRVALLMLPDAPGFTIPTEQQVIEGLAAVDAEDIEAYKDEMRTDPLIPNLPAPGSITAQQTLAGWDATEFTLSNGIKVVVKPTTFKENDIQFYAMAKGGYSVLPDTDAASIIFMPYAMSKNGLGDYSNSDLTKYLQGKQVSLNIDIDKYDRSLAGVSTVQDLPQLMELIFANFTEYNIKPDEFTAMQNMIKGVLANQESTPDYAFQSLIYKTLYQAPALQTISTSLIDQASCSTTVDVVRTMLANAGDFTFYFVGNIDVEAFKPLMEQYIATLPTTAKSITLETSAKFEPVLGTNTVEQSMNMSTPQTWAFYFIGGHKDFTAKERAMASMVAQIMSNRLLNKVREEMGATYSIGAGGQLARFGESNLFFQIPFPMKPEMRQEVFAAVDAIIASMAQDVTEDELAPVREYMVKNATSALEENDAWAQAMASTSLNGVNCFLGAADVYNSVSTKDLMEFWNSVLAQGNRQLIILNPAE